MTTARRGRPARVALAQPSSAMAAAAPALVRTLSTPRSSVDTNQVGMWVAAAVTAATAAAGVTSCQTAGAQSRAPPCLPPPQDSFFEAAGPPRFALRAGPRATIYSNPSTTRMAIVTAGGLCPGLNDIIRALVLKASASSVLAPRPGRGRRLAPLPGMLDHLLN